MLVRLEALKEKQVQKDIQEGSYLPLLRFHRDCKAGLPFYVTLSCKGISTWFLLFYQALSQGLIRGLFRVEPPPGSGLIGVRWSHLLEPSKNTASSITTSGKSIGFGASQRIAPLEHLEEARVDMCYHIIPPHRPDHVAQTLIQLSVQKV